MTSHVPVFLIKRVYYPPAAEDGTRVMVDRLWPRGLNKQDSHWDYWFKDVAPSTELRQWFNHKPERFDEFSQRYRDELADNAGIEKFAGLIEAGPVTLLYAARDPVCNHAAVLANFLQQHF